MSKNSYSFENIYKILPLPEYQHLHQLDFYQGNHQDQQDGFIHLSLAEQVQTIAQKYYTDLDFVIWRIPVNKLSSGLKLEANKPGGTHYPHYYGSIDLGLFEGIDIVKNVEELSTR